MNPTEETARNGRWEDSPLDKSVALSMSEAFALLEETKTDKESGLLLNYTDDEGHVDFPTKEDYLDGKPSHMAWNSPTEDGAYFNGLYLFALCCVAEYGEAPMAARAAEAAHRVARGLLALERLGPDGFIARVARLGVSYACSSADQVFPWFFGMWRYLHFGGADPALAAQCRAAVERTGKGLNDTAFRVPCMPRSFGFMGNYRLATLRDVCKYPFFLRVMYEVTGDETWLARYEAAWDEAPVGGSVSRLEFLRASRFVKAHDGESVFYCLSDGKNIEKVFGERPPFIPLALFTGSMIHMALYALCRMDTDPRRLSVFTAFLREEGRDAVSHVPRWRGQNRYPWPAFSGDWRKMNVLWRPQVDPADSVRLAFEEMPLWFEVCPRFPYEDALIREPLFASCIVALSASDDTLARARPLLEEQLTSIPWEKLNTSTYYAALLAYGLLLERGF